MFFYLKYDPLALSQDVAIEVCEDRLPAVLSNQKLYLQKGAQFLFRKPLSNGEFVLFGDPVFPATTVDWATFIRSNEEIDQDALFQTIRGHYYWFYLRPGGCSCGASLGAIYPVYYHQSGSEWLFSSASFFLAKSIGEVSLNKKNLLERLLFNYPFFNSTWWNEIQLLASHRYLQIKKGKLSVAGDFEVSRYFGKVEDTSKKSLLGLAKVFQEETTLFFPDAPFGISLTGGFDGRTLVAAARKAGRSFSTYSFGRPESTDISFPAQQAPKLNIPYQPIYLDENYLKDLSLGAADDFMSLSEYNGNLGRPHYAYAARELSKEVDFILTGNFGSELFRALHNPGVMISQSLIDVFGAKDDSWKDRLKASTEQWDAHYFSEALDELVEEMDQYLQARKNMDPNHRFYQFVYNDLFRKYFGPELQMQSHFFNNRTPYLSLHLMQALNRTIWSGVHARLFEQQKSKRMKGQMFYSAFIRYADKKMYHMTTNKAYTPADVLEPWRLPFLVAKILIRKYAKPAEDNENATEDFFQLHYETLATKIRMAEMPTFMKRNMEASLQEIPSGKSLTHWIKFYSIMEGFHAAQQQTAQIVQ